MRCGQVWALPFSLAATKGIANFAYKSILLFTKQFAYKKQSSLLFIPPLTEMFYFSGYAVP